MAAVALSVASLAACTDSGKAPQFPPLCPTTGILRDAADLTRFRGTGTDITDMVIDGRITGLGGSCALDDKTQLRTKLTINMDFTRGPAAAGHDIDVTYFIAVTKGQTILQKKIFGLTVQFEGNADRVLVRTDEADLVLPVDDKTQGDAYGVLVGFQLTPAEVQFNRQRGVR